ncbi:MAG: transcription antitermination protein NusG [Sedimentibacter sp.]|jgi:transcription antitermination factor NusG|nr:transcription antitermination protein NusG [Sedimentibacter sp.]
MARKWFVGYFYSGYLDQLMKIFNRKEEFSDVRIWNPQTYEVVVKDGKKIEITSNMFDSYILFEFEEGSLIWKKIIKSTPIISFLTDDSNNPIPITEQEVIHIKEIECTSKVVDYTILINKKVIVTAGPFANFTGMCKTIIKNKYKARVFIEMFGMVERSVEINLEDLKLADQE